MAGNLRSLHRAPASSQTDTAQHCHQAVILSEFSISRAAKANYLPSRPRLRHCRNRLGRSHRSWWCLLHQPATSGSRQLRCSSLRGSTNKTLAKTLQARTSLHQPTIAKRFVSRELGLGLRSETPAAWYVTAKRRTKDSYAREETLAALIASNASSSSRFVRCNTLAAQARWCNGESRDLYNAGHVSTRRRMLPTLLLKEPSDGRDRCFAEHRISGVRWLVLAPVLRE